MIKKNKTINQKKKEGQNNKTSKERTILNLQNVNIKHKQIQIWNGYPYTTNRIAYQKQLKGKKALNTHD